MTALASPPVERPSAGIGDRITTPDGVEISVREWGNPDGPEILFIHGIAQAHLSFSRQFRSELAKTFRLVAYDLRGHGDSEKPFNPAYYRDGRRWADEVQAVIDGRRLRRPIAVGWSLGGRVLRQYLAEHGDGRLSGVSIVSSRAIEDPSILGSGSHTIINARPTDLAGRIEANIAFLRDCFERQPDARDFEVAVAYNMMMPPQVREAINGWATDPELSRQALRAVKVPALISHGDADRLVLPGASTLIAEAMPHARVSWYAGCGHSPFFEDHQRFNRELAEFATAAWSSHRAA